MKQLKGSLLEADLSNNTFWISRYTKKACTYRSTIITSELIYNEVVKDNSWVTFTLKQTLVEHAMI